jgi:hypothetical protein
MTGYMKLIVDAMPLEMLAYPIRRVIDVIALRALKSRTFHISLKELRRRVFFLKNAYAISTNAAIPQRYERMSKFVRPAVIRAILKRGEKPKDADDIAA